MSDNPEVKTGKEKQAELRARTDAALPKFEYDPDAEPPKPKYACDRLRWQLKACLLQSDCCAIDKRSPKECLATKDRSVPDECHQLKYSFISCKRSMIDPRSRFRGRKGDHR